MSMEKVTLTATNNRFPEKDCIVLFHRENLLTITDIKITGQCGIIVQVSRPDGYTKVSPVPMGLSSKEIPIPEFYNGLFFELGFIENNRDEKASIEFYYSTAVV